MRSGTVGLRCRTTRHVARDFAGAALQGMISQCSTTGTPFWTCGRQQRGTLEHAADQLARAESRLGVSLPASYREFLEATNGCLTVGHFVDELWPVESIDWFQKLNPQWVEAYTGPHLPYAPTVSDEKYYVYDRTQDPAYLRVEYLVTALQISPPGDSAVYLLRSQSGYAGR